MSKHTCIRRNKITCTSSGWAVDSATSVRSGKISGKIEGLPNELAYLLPYTLIFANSGFSDLDVPGLVIIIFFLGCGIKHLIVLVLNQMCCKIVIYGSDMLLSQILVLKSMIFERRYLS